jgi:UDP-N-acetyl-D-glucosamine/UDP-N-acetyl-D-galactosamine dehydrogenase
LEIALNLEINRLKVAVIGLGYVGLPLAYEFAKGRDVVGFDINTKRIADLKNGNDRTREVSSEELSNSPRLHFTSDTADLKTCNFYIVTVPTPIDEHKIPDLLPLVSASKMLGTVLKRGDIVVYESTVYPGATEGTCVPILEQVSGLKFNIDFFAGYSPERVNPGDKLHKIPLIKKVTSGSTPEIAEIVNDLYGTIITAGTFKASSIAIAEAAKVIENTQRDLNIALMNEFALIFGILGIDTQEILAAAATKWNFLPFKPGLVGGHCIGVDPYYLTYRAQEVGYHPEVILAGRRINDRMGKHVSECVIKLMLRKGIHVAGSRVLVLGLAFKENCPDIRNSRVVDVIEEMRSFNTHVDVYDPWVSSEEASHEYGLQMLPAINNREPYDAIIVAVGHSEFASMGVEKLRAICAPNAVIYDIKSIFDKSATDGRL